MSASQPDTARQRWVFQIHKSALTRLNTVRLDGDLEIGADTDHNYWVRGTGLTADRYQTLAAISDTAVFLIDELNRLIPYGRTVPTGRLPALNWVALKDFFSASLPTPGRIRDSDLKIELSLCRSDEVRNAAALFTDWETFVGWGLSAPQVRLRVLKFAVSDQRVFVIGNPLPPLPGHRYWEAGRVFVPLGYSWKPAIDQASLSSTFSLHFARSHPENQHRVSDDVMFIWHAGAESIEPVLPGDLYAASHLALRQTRSVLSHSMLLPEIQE